MEEFLDRYKSVFIISLDILFNEWLLKGAADLVIKKALVSWSPAASLVWLDFCRKPVSFNPGYLHYQQLFYFFLPVMNTSATHALRRCDMYTWGWIASNTSNCAPPHPFSPHLPPVLSFIRPLPLVFLCPRLCRYWTWVMMLSSLLVSIYQCQMGSRKCGVYLSVVCVRW